MDYNVQSDKSIISLNNIVLDELQLCIKEFLKSSLPMVRDRYIKANACFRILFAIGKSKYINHKFVREFPTVESDNIFCTLYCAIRDLFDMVLGTNVMDSNYGKHIKLVLQLNYIRRLIYESPVTNGSQGSVKIVVPSILPSSITGGTKYRSIENYGSCHGIANLLEKLGWVAINQHEGYTRFDIRYNNCPLRDLLGKLDTVYNSISKVEGSLMQLITINDQKLSEILGTEQDNGVFIAWKGCLRFNGNQISEEEKIDILRSNYDEFRANNNESINLGSNRRILATRGHSSGSKKGVVYEGIIEIVYVKLILISSV
jgi:hypothetical protein